MSMNRRNPLVGPHKAIGHAHQDRGAARDLRPARHASGTSGWRGSLAKKLIEYGGIYLDADVLVHRSFDDLLGNSAVLGREGFDEEDLRRADAIILENGERLSCYAGWKIPDVPR